MRCGEFNGMEYIEQKTVHDNSSEDDSASKRQELTMCTKTLITDLGKHNQDMQGTRGRRRHTELMSLVTAFDGLLW